MLTILFSSCTTLNKMTNKAIHYAIVGQNEKTIYSRVGIPKSIIPASDGGKILLYESYSKGMFTTPYKSKVTYSANKDLLGNREGVTFNSGANTETNDPKYTIYQNDVSLLKVFMNKQGKCVRFEQNLTRNQLEMYYEQFKRYIPEN